MSDFLELELHSTWKPSGEWLQYSTWLSSLSWYATTVFRYSKLIYGLYQNFNIFIYYYSKWGFESIDTNSSTIIQLFFWWCKGKYHGPFLLLTWKRHLLGQVNHHIVYMCFNLFHKVKLQFPIERCRWHRNIMRMWPPHSCDMPSWHYTD